MMMSLMSGLDPIARSTKEIWKRSKCAGVVLSVGILALSSLLGCAKTHAPVAQETRSALLPWVDLTKFDANQEEIAYLQYIQRQYPEHASDETWFREGLAIMRRTQLRRDALAIQFKNQYPNIHQQDLEVLVDDAMEQERQKRIRQSQNRDDVLMQMLLNQANGPGPTSCISNTFMGAIYTDCF